MTPLKAWLKDAPDPGPATGERPAPGFENLIEFISRKREGQQKRSEAELRKRAAAIKAYERVKRGA